MLLWGKGNSATNLAPLPGLGGGHRWSPFFPLSIFTHYTDSINLYATHDHWAILTCSICVRESLWDLNSLALSTSALSLSNSCKHDQSEQLRTDGKSTNQSPGMQNPRLQPSRMDKHSLYLLFSLQSQLQLFYCSVEFSLLRFNPRRLAAHALQLCHLQSKKEKKKKKHSDVVKWDHAVSTFLSAGTEWYPFV